MKMVVITWFPSQENSCAKLSSTSTFSVQLDTRNSPEQVNYIFFYASSFFMEFCMLNESCVKVAATCNAFEWAMVLFLTILQLGLTKLENAFASRRKTLTA